MTKEKAIERLNRIKIHGADIPSESIDIQRRDIEVLDMAIKALEQESNMEQFVEWVATEIFDEDWKYNADVFAEIACRKLAKLGIVRKNGGTWELVEPQNREEEE
jgi:hypothetical protein